MPESDSTGLDGPEPRGTRGEDELAAGIDAADPADTQHVVGAGFDEEPAEDADDVRDGVAAPIASPRVGAAERVVFDGVPETVPVYWIEQSGPEPTPLLNRVGRSSRMFVLWFAVTASFVSVALGMRLFSLGLSGVQVIIATLIGAALSLVPLGLGTLAGKWSGQPTMVVSRATFGVWGNVVPAALAVVVRLVWCAFLLCLAGGAVGAVAVALGWASDGWTPTIVGALSVLVVSGVIAVCGYALLYLVQIILAIASTVLLVLTVALTSGAVDLAAAARVPDGLWLNVMSGAILVFSYIGLAWANSGADLARYQRPASSGSSAMLWATFGAGLPAVALIGYGGLLAASHPDRSARFASDPFGTLLGLTPGWIAVPVFLVATLGLVSAVVINLYSGGLALGAVGVRLARPIGVLVMAVGVAVLTVLILLGRPAPGSLLTLPVTLAVPVAAWAGLFSAEMMIRKRRFAPGGLLRRGRIYPDVRWINLAALVLITVVGYGLVVGPVSWLSWQGYLFAPLGINPNGMLAASNVGVLVALVLGLLAPLGAGIRAIRRQEDVRR